jgi:hypothetical protein
MQEGRIYHQARRLVNIPEHQMPSVRMQSINVRQNEGSQIRPVVHIYVYMYMVHMTYHARYLIQAKGIVKKVAQSRREEIQKKMLA